ncbi:MAG TPA: UDP-N-acetylmuramoyl-L-alanine--D-glutamate ligase [Pyrinomonadaceae bacterium]|nr:UDP-N-acetylmuramoyl-L-alanine--D-glutamate ligase [Chloracidobacterium sp.]MBP9108622.1 UDP-N-acetylmuramoyl-L-alanine--D-glutamate ligase [Pyrinomonadaceae bacterium]MBK9439717.1 UDP-N-acetylmuramoyl-L-alanine--D-glutamate ligase [Chloracidobacterium sp.]MBK9768465.1 UDP-N-acetylmuramoyl-L-alanine--D-glutamate ligase [Chloracidobacterium sp.]MBL0238990.1 UDP-N-acetylmuramoyl-L-alanine--D-glutamate ligase [Chloracidobacterium sp.]
MELEGKKTLVLGAGRSGIAAARFLAERGAVVALHDKKEVETWPEAAQSLKESHGVGLISGQLPSWLLDQIELVVISPGVPTNTIPARYVDRNDGEVIGEVELAFRFMKGRIVGITGSNGKTTTTTLVGELLRNSGIKTQVGGNIGTPLLSLAESSDDDTWTVVELSSFQLETIKDFRADVAMCLNVTPNHLDRYESFFDYALAKHRIFMNQTDSNVAVLNADDEITAEWASGLKAHVVMFSIKRELDEGLFLRGRELICRSGGKEKVLTTRDEIFLRGLHNVENVLAAFAAGLACGASPDSMRETVAAFKGVEHRIEYVDEIRGVQFYNDSKATSVDATTKALEALSEIDGKTILILGGRGKNAPYAPLIPLIEHSVRSMVVIGEDSDNIAEQLTDHVPIVRASSLEDAVKKCFGVAETGDAVLLAPACASFDMFGSYEERGREFKRLVAELKGSIDRA